MSDAHIEQSIDAQFPEIVQPQHAQLRNSVITWRSLVEKGELDARLAVLAQEPARQHAHVWVMHKSASVYIYQVLQTMLLQLGRRCIDLNILQVHNYDKPEQEIPFRDIMLLNKPCETVFLGRRYFFTEYADPDLQTIPMRHVFVVRDPRDAIVSYYFSLKYSHIDNMNFISERRRKLLSLDRHEGLLYAIKDFNDIIADYACKWLDYAQTNSVLILRYEDLVEDAWSFFNSILEYNQVDVPEGLLKDSIGTFTFENLAGRQPGSENKHSHYRKGVVGDWKNHLTEAHIDLFSKMSNCTRMMKELQYTVFSS